MASAVTLTLPYTQNFTNEADYTVGGNDLTGPDEPLILTRSHQATGGYGDNGGCTRYDIVAFVGEDSAGMGYIDWTPVSQLNVGFMFWAGATYEDSLNKGEMIKAMIIHDEGRGGAGTARPTLGHHNYFGDYRTFGACSNAGGDCYYSPGGGEWPDGNDYFQIPAYAETWVWIEYQVVIDGTNTLFIDTQDSALAGTYAQEASLNSAPYDYNEIDTIFGYWEGSVAGSIDSDSYFKIDLLKIQSGKIGPPVGFTGGAAAVATPTSVTGTTLSGGVSLQ